MKKTNKVNPITTFRKLNEARNGMIMKSLKKAQDGFGVNDTMNDDMINKAGSTGGYKVPTPTWSAEESANISKAISGLTRPKDMLGANAERMMALQGKAASGVADSVANANRNDALNNFLWQQAKNNMLTFNRKTGGTHKMPNGKIMLNSAMKKKTSKKK